MKKITLPFIAIIAAAAISCHSKTIPVSSGNKLKARFEVAGLCSNYTFSVTEGNMDTSKVVASWTNPQTNKTYLNAFGILNPCDLPQGLKEGDEFYFEITDKSAPHCAVCMAYYPTPEKKLNIKVLQVIKK